MKNLMLISYCLVRIVNSKLKAELFFDATQLSVDF